MLKKRLCFCILFIVFLLIVLMAVISKPSSSKPPKLKLYERCLSTEQCRRSISHSYCALQPNDDENFRCYCDKGYFESDDDVICTPYRKCSKTTENCLLNEHCRKGVCVCDANYVFNSDGVCVYFKSNKNIFSSNEELKKAKLAKVLSKEQNSNNASHTKIKAILKWSLFAFAATCCIGFVCFLVKNCKNENRNNRTPRNEVPNEQSLELINGQQPQTDQHSGNSSN